MVETQDNSIFRIDAYVNPDGFKLKDQYIKLTEQVFQTILNGSRTNIRKARKETLKIFGTEKKFEFDLPDNYCITIDQQYDFQVFKFHKYTNYGDSNWVDLVIYTGDHPSYFYNEYGFKKDMAIITEGRFLNSQVQWLFFKNESNGIYLKEQQVPSDNIRTGLIVHIAMVGNNNIAIDELAKIVEGIKLID
jgi:hypothetical protein